MLRDLLAMTVWTASFILMAALLIATRLINRASACLPDFGMIVLAASCQRASRGASRRRPQAFARRAALQQLSLFRSGGYKWHNHSSFKIENAVLYLKNWRILSLARDRTEKALHIYLITR
jgi:hypothetical protein